jgi:hypothetical protein
MVAAILPLPLYPPHSVKTEKAWSPSGIQHAAYLQRYRDSILAGTRDISRLYSAQIDSVAHRMDSRGYFRGYKVAEGEDEHSPKSTAKVKQGWRDIFTPQTCLYGMVI